MPVSTDRGRGPKTLWNGAWVAPSVPPIYEAALRLSRGSGTLWTSNTTLADATGYSITTVKRAKRVLLKLGVLEPEAAPFTYVEHDEREEEPRWLRHTFLPSGISTPARVFQIAVVPVGKNLTPYQIQEVSKPERCSSNTPSGASSCSRQLRGPPSAASFEAKTVGVAEVAAAAWPPPGTYHHVATRWARHSAFTELRHVFGWTGPLTGSQRGELNKSLGQIRKNGKTDAANAAKLNSRFTMLSQTWAARGFRNAPRPMHLAQAWATYDKIDAGIRTAYMEQAELAERRRARSAGDTPKQTRAAQGTRVDVTTPPVDVAAPTPDALALLGRLRVGSALRRTRT